MSNEVLFEIVFYSDYEGIVKIKIKGKINDRDQ